MLQGVLPTNDGWSWVSRTRHDELIVGADAAVGIRMRVKYSARHRVHAGLSDVERVEVQPQLADVQI